MDIEITRSGKWEVQVDGVIFSSHNEPKEGYENLIEQTVQNPGKVVRLIPNFTVRADVTEAQDVPFALTEVEVEQYISELPLFETGNEYSYVLFELDNDGLKNFSEIKTISV